MYHMFSVIVAIVEALVDSRCLKFETPMRLSWWCVCAHLGKPYLKQLQVDHYWVVSLLNLQDSSLVSRWLHVWYGYHSSQPLYLWLIKISTFQNSQKNLPPAHIAECNYPNVQDSEGLQGLPKQTAFEIFSTNGVLDNKPPPMWNVWKNCVLWQHPDNLQERWITLRTLPEALEHGLHGIWPSMVLAAWTVRNGVGIVTRPLHNGFWDFWLESIDLESR
jgi:hypothetical protein